MISYHWQNIEVFIIYKRQLITLRSSKHLPSKKKKKLSKPVSLVNVQLQTVNNYRYVIDEDLWIQPLITWVFLFGTALKVDPVSIFSDAFNIIYHKNTDISPPYLGL